ncbi:Ig-like domain-containing protein [Enterococcus faecalis]
MVGKNNKKLLELKSNPIIKKWRISRLKTGVASIVIFSGVLLSSTIFIPLHTVSAEETVNTTYYNQSKNVSDQLTNTSISISNHNKEKIIFPHNAESLTSNYAFKVPDSVNPKDYFYIDLSKNGNFYGITEVNSVAMPNLLAPDNSIIATGKYDIDTNRIRYEFTDYVAEHDNVSGKISLPIFIDPEVVTNTSYQTITASIGNSKQDLTLLVDYSKNVGPQYNANGAGNIFNVDLNNHNFSHTIYVNSLKQTLGNKSIEIRNQRKEENGYNSEIIYDKTNTKIKVYKVRANGSLTDSFSIATNDSLEDVTNQCYIDFYDNKININFPSNIDNETYVVQYTSPYTDKKDIATRVVMYGYSPYQLGNTSWYWDNYVKLTNGNASGDGSVVSPDPETPVTPEDPDPEKPVNPDPETPVTPEDPDPEKPVNPDPETPVTPEDPDPEKPVNPDPETPVTPEDPDPEKPVNPNPETPVTPEDPDPEKPVNPDPETPVTPEDSGKAVTLKNTTPKTLITEKNMSNNNSKSNNTLPQTGEKESSGILAGLVILLSSIAVGIKLNRKRKNI